MRKMPALYGARKRQFAGQPGDQHRKVVIAARNATLAITACPPRTPDRRGSSVTCRPSGLTRTNSFGTWSRSDEIDLGDERLARPLLPRARRVEHLLKAHRRLVRRLRQLAQADVLHDDVDLVGGRVGQERLEHAGSARSGRSWRRPGPARGRTASLDSRAGRSPGGG